MIDSFSPSVEVECIHVRSSTAGAHCGERQVPVLGWRHQALKGVVPCQVDYCCDNNPSSCYLACLLSSFLSLLSSPLSFRSPTRVGNPLSSRQGAAGPAWQPAWPFHLDRAGLSLLFILEIGVCLPFIRLLQLLLFWSQRQVLGGSRKIFWKPFFSSGASPSSLLECLFNWCW